MHSSAEFSLDAMKPRMLVIEDDPDQSDFLRDVLESEGFLVETAFSGDIALRWLLEKEYAGAIMDVRMPGLNGGMVLKACRAQTPSVTTPIIMVSAFASPKDQDQFKRDGAAAFLSKPYDIDLLLKTVHAVTHFPAHTRAEP